MAASSIVISLSLLPGRTQTVNSQHQQVYFLPNSYYNGKNQKKPVSFRVQAVNPPAGVEFPKVEPQLEAPFLGFTKTAEIWNSRACMIGIIGVFIVELILNRGILQVIGVDVGKGLNLPL